MIFVSVSHLFNCIVGKCEYDMATTVLMRRIVSVTRTYLMDIDLITVTSGFNQINSSFPTRYSNEPHINTVDSIDAAFYGSDEQRSNYVSE